MNELNLYAIVKAILEKSKVIEGRFRVAPQHTSELNSNDIGALLVDAIDKISDSRKFPVCLMLPPAELPNWERNWSRFKLRLFFLAKPNSNNAHTMMAQTSTNTSLHTIEYTWKDMRECAGDFRSFFEDVLYQRGLLDKIRPATSTEMIERVSGIGNDSLAGVCLSFDIELFMPCERSDYADVLPRDIDLNTSDIHPIHKH